MVKYNGGKEEGKQGFAVNEQQKQTLAEFREYIKKIRSYEEAVALMQWDMRTGAPKKGVPQRSEVIGELATEMFKMTVSDRMGAYLDALEAPDVLTELGEIDRKIVTECRKEYERNRKIPTEMYQEYVVLTNHAESVWEDAKRANDWTTFEPYLEKIVAFNQKFVELWGYEENKYDTLLELYEPGMTVSVLDRVFGELRDEVVPLVTAVAESANKPETSFLEQTFDKEAQRDFGLYILEQMGYDFEAGRLDESEHPFAIGLNPGDVRITTRYKPDDVTFALFGTIHEGGHAQYEQNISQDLVGTNLCTGTSMGIHESQSRFWEIFVGLSWPFWKRYFGELQKHFPSQLGGVTEEQFYRAVNVAEPSLIRIEADDLTYNLHIIIRYELEKGLINGDIKVHDLPRLWNEKYEQYLGITPPNDREGVLQDVHWAGGAFGYFPSYALGGMYAAQMLASMKKDLPNFELLVEKGELHPIKEWLGDKVHRFGKLKDPAEIIMHATGEALNPQYLIDYMKQKFTEIYKL